MNCKEDTYKRNTSVIRHVFGNVLRLSVPLTRRVVDVIDGSGIIVRNSEPSWHKIWLNLRSLNREPSNNSFNGNDTFIRTAYPEYISGDNGVQSENGKIYKADHDYSQGANGNYITNGWYTNYEKPTLAFSTDDTEIWEIEVIHIVSGVITQRKIITTNIAGT